MYIRRRNPSTPRRLLAVMQGNEVYRALAKANKVPKTAFVYVVHVAFGFGTQPAAIRM